MAKNAISWIAFILFLCLLGTVTSGAKIVDHRINLADEVSAQMKVAPNQLISSTFSTTPTPRTYYVDAVHGKDSNDGLSTSSAFQTIQTAANLTNPGDTVLIMNGTYTNSPTNNGQVVEITNSGTANAWITYKAYTGHSPKIQHNAWNGILIHNGASYIEINGLEIAGNNPHITLSYAQSKQQDGSDPTTNGNCITVDGRQNGHPHNIRIINNKVHDCGGGGIATIQADYITIQGNQVYNNAWYSVYGSSAISLWQNWRSDDNTQAYKMLIQNNKVYNNREYIPWIYVGAITDGNGIIIDDSRNTQNGSTLGAYTGRTLISNNFVYNNGGRGIAVYSSDNVDIIHNTTHNNQQSPEIKGGEIGVNSASYVNVINNILNPNPNKQINDAWDTKNVTFDYNLYGKTNPTAQVAIQGTHDFFGDTKFVNSSSPDLRLQSTSIAIDSNPAWQDPITQTKITSDFSGNPRPSGRGYDVGAYEYQFN